MCDIVNHCKEEVHPLIMASVFHYEFVFIHPFSDGNGRMARLWHTAFLTKWNSVFEYIPIEKYHEIDPAFLTLPKEFKKRRYEM